MEEIEALKSEIKLLRHLQENLEVHLTAQAKLIVSLIASHPKREDFFQAWGQASAKALTSAFLGTMGAEKGAKPSRQQINALFQQGAYEQWEEMLQPLRQKPPNP